LALQRGKLTDKQGFAQLCWVVVFDRSIHTFKPATAVVAEAVLCHTRIDSLKSSCYGNLGIGSS